MHRAKDHLRIALIIPYYRTWLWHRRIVSLLQESFAVDVYTSKSMRRYPKWLNFWLRLETLIVGQVDLVKLAPISDTAKAKAWPPAFHEPYAFVINLSEAPAITFANVPVLEPRYGNSKNSLNLLAALVAGKNPYLSFQLVGQNELIVASYLAIQDRIVLIRGLQLSFSRLISLIERAAHHVAQGSRGPIPPGPAEESLALSAVVLWKFFSRFMADKLVGRVIRLLQLREHWSIAFGRSKPCDIPYEVPLSEFVVLPDDRLRYYADPFLFTDQERRWLFVEEFEYRTGKGVISCAPLTTGEAAGRMTTPVPVLTRPYHLSYPFIFRYAGEIYMIPESASNHTVELFRARSFPSHWEQYRVLLHNIQLYDNTLLWHNSKWWMFGAVGQNGGSTQDELAIFYAERLEGPWFPHTLNPVKSDCRSARPAGRVITRDNRLIRPAQDCEAGYGAGLVWLEIEELTPDAFRERELVRWPGSVVRAEGLHTFNCDEDVGVFDFRRTIWKFRRALRNVE